jgi:hypothetical protein
MSLWRELTALYCLDEPRIYYEIEVGRPRSYRCSYKIILRRKHAVHQSTNPFHTERYSRLRHLAASFLFSAHAKNIKALLPNRPIHWRTLHYYRGRCSKYRPHIFKLESSGDSLSVTAVFFVTHFPNKG